MRSMLESSQRQKWFSCHSFCSQCFRACVTMCLSTAASTHFPNESYLLPASEIPSDHCRCRDISKQACLIWGRAWGWASGLQHMNAGAVITFQFFLKALRSCPTDPLMPVPAGRRTGTEHRKDTKSSLFQVFEYGK